MARRRGEAPRRAGLRGPLLPSREVAVVLLTGGELAPL